MDEIAPEYDVVVLGTGERIPLPTVACETDIGTGLTECVLSGCVDSSGLYETSVLTSLQSPIGEGQESAAHRQE